MKKPKNESPIIHGQLRDDINYTGLIQAQANTPTFKDGPKKYKVVSVRKISGLRRGTGKTLKMIYKGTDRR